jgi:hypothetical protein
MRLLAALIALVLLAGCGAQAGAAPLAQTPERAYLPLVGAPPPTPTFQPTPVPTPSPSTRPWRRPDGDYLAITVVDVDSQGATVQVVSVRNDTGRTFDGYIIVWARFNEAGQALAPEQVVTRSARLVPGELQKQTVLLFRAVPPGSRIEAFGIPEP